MEVVDGYDGDVLRVYFSITNNTDEANDPFMLLTLSAYQDGIELTYGSAKNSIDSDNLMYDDLEPGQSVDFSYCWTLLSASPVEVTVADYYADDYDVDAAAIVTLE